MFKVFLRSTKISSHKTKINNKTIQITENGLKIKLIQWLIIISFHALHLTLPIIWHCVNDFKRFNLPELTPLNFLTKMVSWFQNISIPYCRWLSRIPRARGGSLNWKSGGMGGYNHWNPEGIVTKWRHYIFYLQSYSSALVAYVAGVERG